jgi:DnaJ domain
MSADPEGYYSDLGVSPSATADEVRAIYRALAKIYHPDVNPDPAAPERFRRFTTAYEVLSDPERRRAYDSELSGGNRTTGPQPPPETEEDAVPPIECSVCRKTTVEPRFLVFRGVISAILVTRIILKPGVYCSRCASKTALRASAISAAFGWWGLPWGPFSTIKAIATNVLGGEQNPDIDEQLLWQNAIAFFQDRKLDLAASLAFHLRSASDDQIARAARQLLQFLSCNGVKPEKLASTWACRPGSAIGQILLGAIVPVGVLLIAIASYIDSDGQRAIYAHLLTPGSVEQLAHSDPPAPIPATGAWPVPPASRAAESLPVVPEPTEAPNAAIAEPPAPDDISPAEPRAAKSAASAAPSHEATRCCKDQAGYPAREFDIPPKSAVQPKLSIESIDRRRMRQPGAAKIRPDARRYSIYPPSPSTNPVTLSLQHVEKDRK